MKAVQLRLQVTRFEVRTADQHGQKRQRETGWLLEDSLAPSMPPTHVARISCFVAVHHTGRRYVAEGFQATIRSALWYIELIGVSFVPAC